MLSVCVLEIPGIIPIHNILFTTYLLLLLMCWTKANLCYYHVTGWCNRHILQLIYYFLSIIRGKVLCQQEIVLWELEKREMQLIPCAQCVPLELVVTLQKLPFVLWPPNWAPAMICSLAQALSVSLTCFGCSWWFTSDGHPHGIPDLQGTILFVSSLEFNGCLNTL